MSGPRLYTIPPGVPFLPRLAETLCNGDLIDGFVARPEDPLALSTATIYLPTRRAARALRSVFPTYLGKSSAILPTIHALGESEDDVGFVDTGMADPPDMRPPIGGIDRVLELARLIALWKQNLPASVSEFHGGERLIAPASPADAVWLARELAALLDSMETQEVPWSELNRLVGEDFATWWQLTLEFLKIAGDYWPKRLKELSRSSPVHHRNTILRAQAASLLSSLPAGPVIIAGSTGSIPATAELMKAVAELEQGAIILPGLDEHLKDDVWSVIGGDPEAAEFDPAICGHPQFGLYALLKRLQIDRSEVKNLGQPSPNLKQRSEVISRSLMPAAATELWAETVPNEEALAGAFDKVELIEAASEREEALSIAIAIRLAAQEPALNDDGSEGVKRIALVTPDRNLARRVASELTRFGIDASDSGGTPLSLAPQASLLQLLLQFFSGSRKTAALVSMLKHPLARFGWPAAQTRHAARVLERMALRGGMGEPQAGSLKALFDRRLSERTAQSRHRPQWQRRLTDTDIELAGELAERIDTSFASIIAMDPDSDLDCAQWARLTGELLEAVAKDEDGSISDLWDDEAGESLATLLGAVGENRSELSCNRDEWAAMVPALMAGEMVKPRAGGHPHIFIWGTLEARLQEVDTLILAGLNEGTWPGAAVGDPFLSRAMKALIGLDPPERRIGLAAHDFQMGLGMPHVVLSRSLRSQNAPTVASRWLLRLEAVIGQALTADLREKGNRYIDWASELDREEDVPLATRPVPRPPAAVQPRRYSFSEVKTLRRDPYAIYARRVLRLDPAEPLIADPGPAERGTLYHHILECFISEVDRPGDPAAAATLSAIAKREFSAAGLPEPVRLVWQHQFAGLIQAYIDWEGERSSEIVTRYTERRALMSLEGPDIIVSGIADRIDIRPDGTAEILDFKTGTSPSRKVAWSLLDPQLPLEAAALSAGAFDGLSKTEPGSLAYIRLRPGSSLAVDRIEGRPQNADRDKSAIELGEEAVERLADLVFALREGRLGFASQVIPDPLARFGRDYDHLARVQEWSAADADSASGGDSQ